MTKEIRNKITVFVLFLTIPILVYYLISLMICTAPGSMVLNQQCFWDWHPIPAFFISIIMVVVISGILIE